MLNGLTRKELGVAADVLRVLIANGKTLLTDALPVLEAEMQLRLKQRLRGTRPGKKTTPKVYGVCPQCGGPVYKERLARCQCPKTLPQCRFVLFCDDDTCNYYEIRG